MAVMAGWRGGGSLGFLGASGLGRFPRWLPIVFLVICTRGLFSPPHRGAYVTGICMFLFATLVMPRVAWSRRLGLTAVGAVLLGSALLGGALVMTQATGRD